MKRSKKLRPTSADGPETFGRRVLYFAMEYPRATDTFIQREISGLRDLGMEVESSSVHRPGDEHIVGDEQRQERDRTTYVSGSVPAMLLAHLGLLVRSPKRYLATLALARETSRAGIIGHAKQLQYVFGAGALAALLRRKKFDHLHSHFGDVSTSVAMLASSFSGVPFSFTLHGPGVFFDAHTWRLDEKIERARFVSCISWFCRSQAQLLSSEASAAKLHIVHCGVDPARYVDRATDTANRDQLRLAFVARLDHVKGVTVLLDALDRVRDSIPGIHLDLAGDGPGREAFERRVSDLALDNHVTFHGYVSQTEVAELLATSDLFVLPSFAEGVPVGLMEAQASGLPVIATRVGGVSELVIDGTTGLLCAPGDVEGLAKSIATLAADPELRRSMGAAGRERVGREFASAAEATRLASLFNCVGETVNLGIRPALPTVADGQA